MEEVKTDAQLSRGAKSLIIKDDFENSQIESQNQPENSVQNPAENIGEQIVSGSMYTEDNSELDALLDEATTTQEQHAQNEKVEAKAQSKYMNVEAAMDISLKGLVGLTKMASDYAGKEIEVNQTSAMLFATLTAPMIQKYGARFSFDPSKIDLDSWMPELMAMGGVAVVGYPMFKQIQAPTVKTVNKAPEGAKNGD